MDYRYDFDNNKKGNKKRIIFIILFLIFTLMFVAFFFRDNNNEIIKKISNVLAYPIRIVYDAGKSAFSSVGSYFGDIKNINAENDKLRAENKELQHKLLETQTILNENTSLKKLLEINKEYQHFKLKSGRIIYREHDNWTQSFKIDIGSKDGIKLNQAVIHLNGLVGYISAVDDTTSTVTTILDPLASVSVNISTINEPAILKGDLSLKSDNKLKLEYIPLDAQISISDMLYTSGLGATYPSSIPVGKITQIINNKNDMNRYAIVEPNVNIRTISEVSVVIE